MGTYLQRIKFSEDSENFASQIGWQETLSASSTRLLHLYDENGEQLDSGNGHFPNATWEAINGASHIEDSDDFWQTVECFQGLPE